MASNEENVKRRLKEFLKNKKGYTVLPNEKALPVTTYDKKKRNKPDIIACKGNAILLIECKGGSSLRSIGHTFGQMLAVKLSLKMTSKEKLSRWLKESKEIKVKDIDKARFIFCVALPKYRKYKTTPSNSIREIVTLFSKEKSFEDFRVYKVWRKDDIRKSHRGKSMSYNDLLRDNSK